MNKNAKLVIFSLSFCAACLCLMLLIGNSSNAPIIGFLIVVAIVAALVVIPMLNKSSETTKNTFGENECGEEETVTAKIVLKKTYTPVGSIERFNFIMFEKQTGERIELAIKDDEEYKFLLEGDIGTLTHQGKKYISFIR